MEGDPVNHVLWREGEMGGLIVRRDVQWNLELVKILCHSEKFVVK